MDVLKFRILHTILFLLAPFLPLHAQYNALVWSDEFDYTGLPDASKWTFEEGGGGWGNNELQYYTASRTQNARVENGVLIIEARQEIYSGREYTSARLNTAGKGDWLYGRFEIRARVPGGRGTWPAIWMLPTDWAYGNWPASGEIDIMEHVGYDPTRIFGTAHTEVYNTPLGTQKGSSVEGATWESDFHVYALDWTPDQLEFIVDDQVYYTFPNEGTWQKWPFDRRFHLMLNLAVGGTWGGAQGVDPSIFPKRLEIDYVRVYQSANLKITGPAFLDPGQEALFHATRFTGGTYAWRIPDDATIVSGEGTADLGLAWGHSDGEVAVTVNIGDQTVETANYIRTVMDPAENTWWFGNLTDGNTGDLAPNTSDGSTFDFSESGESLKIVYHTVDPATWPRFDLTLPRPVNLKDHPYCAINLKTWNLSHSMSIRFDFADANGVETNATPVFRPVIIADGQFHFYQNNFSGHWLSSSPEVGKKVDSTRIVRMTAYVNGGVFGQPDKIDSLWIESIRFMRNPLTSAETIELLPRKLTLYPNPATDRITLQAPWIPQSIELYDLRGVLVRHLTGLMSQTVTMDLTNLPAGEYLLRARGREGRRAENKVLKE
jgi:beta-glucanase (GH16 family)